MRKLIILSIALQLCVAGLFGCPSPLNLPSPKWSGETPPPPTERGLGGETDTTPHGSIKILSWNIQMLPKIVGDNGNDLRAGAIGEILKNTDYDIIIFQEAFTKISRERIWNLVQGVYPYQSGKPLGKGLTLINSGVWIISKLPIKTRVDKLYKECDGIDCFAKKGATLVEIEKDGRTFQVVGTHLQADQGKDKIKAREAQYYDLAKLLELNKKEGIPQIVAGDFNTLRSDTVRYTGMLNVLQADDGPLSGAQQYSWDNTRNDITYNSKDTSQVLLDYIFTRNNGFIFTNEIRIIRRFLLYWACTHADLSDHFAVEAKFEY